MTFPKFRENISVRPGDHAPFLETHGNSVKLGRSVHHDHGDGITADAVCVSESVSV